MANQGILWTALPNGYSEDRRSLRVSLLVSPRLEPDLGSGQLADFPDFVDWPATLAQSRFTLYFGTPPSPLASVVVRGQDFQGATRVDDRLGLPDSQVWTALFPATTPVVGFEFRDLTGHFILSYPAVDMDALVRGLYSQLAATASDQLPKVSTFLNDPGWQALLTAVRRNDERYTLRSRDEKTGRSGPIRDVRKQFSELRKGIFAKKRDLTADLALFQLFHTPPSTPRRVIYDGVSPKDAKSRAEWLGYEQKELPRPGDFQKDFHFHKIVAAMNQYPTLLRRLGLVVDLLIARNSFPKGADKLLWAEVDLPHGSPSVTRLPDVSPRTHTLLDADYFQAVSQTPPPGGFRITNGLLDLDPKTFSFVQADVDGSGLKLLGFAQSLITLDRSEDHQVDPVTKKEREIGAPALRNAGLVLVHNQRADMLKKTIADQNRLNGDIEGLQQGVSRPVPELYAKDLVRGYRVDIWDSTSKGWHSLCQRSATYDIDDGTAVIQVPEEEGTVRLAATTSPDPTSNTDIIWLHEILMAWPGWSLCAPAPGKTISHLRDDADPTKDHSEPVTDAEPQVPSGLRLKSAFKALPGSLPRLRYGRSYWLRARAVDLAGNSLQLTDFEPEPSVPAAQPYYRYEPVSAPAIALVKSVLGKTEVPAEGESMERLAVRSFNDTPPLNVVPTPQRARRIAVPSRTTQREAEQHGMLDRGGIVDPSFFAMLAVKDNSLAEERFAGPLAGGTPADAPETRYAVMVDGDALPYLPEPLAVEIAARIFDHPDIPDSKILSIPLYDGTEWPDALPFKIEIYESPADAPHYDSAVRTLFVPLPKAARCTLRLSVQPSAEALKVLGVWNWLTDAQKTQPIVINGGSTTPEKLARTGQHWMLTPWRNLELVHAVQRPLITPELKKVDVSRTNGETFALPNFTATCSIASTDRLDLRASWNEPFGDDKYRTREDHAFSVKITDEKSYAGRNPDYLPQGTDLIRAGGIFHDLVAGKVHEFHDTRYRRIEYWLEATTKFREFMPANLLTVGGTTPTEENIKVVGPKVRTWVPSSAPPPAPEVLYIMPTFGWVRSGNATSKSSWRRGGGLRVYLNRPWNISGFGEMLAVVLPGAGFTGDPNITPTEQPLKNFVTQWGNDPIWQSPFVPGVAPKHTNFPLARTAPDPNGKWLPSFAPAEEADQPPGPFATSGLEHPELNNPSADSLVDVAPHDVFFDVERQLWYCDIEVTWGMSYFPFIRLALARYQPVVAHHTAHLSNVVLADFMPLVPDRWLNVTQTSDPRTRQINIFGNTFTDSSSHKEAKFAPVEKRRLPNGREIYMQATDVAQSSVVEVWVERLDHMLGEDFGWKRESGAVVRPSKTQPHQPAVSPAGSPGADAHARAADLLQYREFEALAEEELIGYVIATPTLWEGTVTLPQSPDASARFRLVIAEYEEYLVDDAEPYDRIPTAKDRRIVFIEYVELK